MTTPVRLQLSRRRGLNLQALSLATNGLPAVNVARLGKWGNPFKVGDPFNVVSGDGCFTRRSPMTAAEAVDKFRRLECGPTRSANIARELRLKNLACWCAPGDACHADVLLALSAAPVCEAV